GWAYQITPFLEEGALAELTTMGEIETATITLYYCPSRRMGTRNIRSGIGLIDYAGVIAGPARGEVEYHVDDFDTDIETLSDPYAPSGSNTANMAFWGCRGCGPGLPSKALGNSLVMQGRPLTYRGIIQRIDWLALDNPALPEGGRHEGWGTKMTYAKITDGSSKTLLVAEKYVHPDTYEGVHPQSAGVPPTTVASEDQGWADGWDCGVMRSTMFPIRNDSDPIQIWPLGSGVCQTLEYGHGSNHPGIINAVFADGSVRTINSDVEQEVFNQMGHRFDGETYDYDF
ncbi:MAG: DUF1559 domain-containing protein, partial [Planctomycetota bacterium]